MKGSAGLKIIRERIRNEEHQYELHRGDYDALQRQLEGLETDSQELITRLAQFHVPQLDAQAVAAAPTDIKKITEPRLQEKLSRRQTVEETLARNRVERAKLE